MHKSIIRSKDEIQKHYDFICNEIETRTGTWKQLSEEIPVLRSIADACYGALNIEDFEPHTSYKCNILTDKYYSDTCLWLQGKFYTAPNYKPLREKQFSAEQVLEDFGKTNFTTFEVG